MIITVINHVIVIVDIIIIIIIIIIIVNYESRPQPDGSSATPGLRRLLLLNYYNIM